MSDSDLARGRRGGAGSLTGVIDMIAKAGVVIGGLFAGWQYWEAKIDQRVERTMAYIVRYEDGRVGDARRRIDANLRAYLPQFQEIAQSGISEADRDEMVLTIVNATPENVPNARPIADDIDLVVDFFEGLNACTSRGLCEEQVARDYFSASDVGLLFTNFEPYFKQRRENNPRFAAAMEAFAGRQ